VRGLIVALSVVALITVACGGGTPAAPVELAGTTNNHGTKTATNDLKVKVSEYFYGPTYLRAGAGQKFTVELSNDGAARHTFTSDALGVDLELPPGAKRTVTLTAPASGASEFHCRFHQGQGMQGAVYVK
jgi:plastocyanin